MVHIIDPRNPTAFNNALQLREHFERMRLVTANILYYRPDYTNILQEFLLQREDIAPEYPRLMGFLGYWKDNIHAVIHEVRVGQSRLISGAELDQHLRHTRVEYVLQ
jgi:uncharacterized protein Usg